ncbi:MAG: glycosyltransferase [Algoriphagus sp.]|nr:glycosyltransferase [Algoriphagus sp.]
MQVVAVIVTYSNRFHLLEQVVKAVFREGVSEVWVVDNGCPKEIKLQIDELKNKTSDLRVFTNQENLGTAGAYSLVLDYGFKRQEDFFFWFLDDDNLPCAGSLFALQEAYKYLSVRITNPVLYSYRGNQWKDDLAAVTKGEIKGPLINGYCGFDIFRYLKSKFSKNSLELIPKDINYPIVGVKYGPYGGLFSRVDNLRRIGLPNNEFFVYVDDHEYTLRLYRSGIPQFLVYSSQIEDLDMSFKDGEDIFSPSISLFKLYYSFRNTAFFYQQIKKSNLIYFINKISFHLIICYWSMFKFLQKPAFIYKRIKFLFNAVRLGENGIFKEFSKH